MKTLHVALPERGYPIYIGPALLARPELLREHIPGGQVLVVTDTTVAPLYLSALREALGDLRHEIMILPDGEQHKTLATWQTILDALLEHRFERRCTVLALGGGVVGDMAGFAAASYQRGVAFVQVPTTVLAQVDSSVGGKTGVNHPLGKNMIGAFHQPRLVLADTDTLNTLPDRQLAAGLAEVVKYGWIRDTAFLDWLDSRLDALLARDSEALSTAVAWSCRIKAEIVAADEREAGQRALLNLGHTFGHAIETATGYRDWLHGEAVAAGMLMAADLSARLGWLRDHHVQRLQDWLSRAELPTMPPALPAEQWLELMARDKKTRDGQLRLVLLRAPGEGVVHDHVEPTTLRATLAAFQARA